MSLKPKGPPTTNKMEASRGGFHAPAKPTRPQLPDDVYGAVIANNHYVSGSATNGYFSPVWSFGDVTEQHKVPTSGGGKKVV